jgi:hypothetical protein
MNQISILMSLKCSATSILNEIRMIFLKFTTIVNNKWCCLQLCTWLTLSYSLSIVTIHGHASTTTIICVLHSNRQQDIWQIVVKKEYIDKKRFTNNKPRREKGYVRAFRLPQQNDYNNVLLGRKSLLFIGLSTTTPAQWAMDSSQTRAT